LLLISDQRDSSKSRKHLEIVAWLSKLNFWEIQDKTFLRHQPGTGEWLLNDPALQNWIKGDIEALWCPGDRTIIFYLITNSVLAGAGKTILAYYPIDVL